MRRMLGIVASLSLIALLAHPSFAEPLVAAEKSEITAPTVLTSLPLNPQTGTTDASPAAKWDGRSRRESVPMSTPIRLAGRCGSSNVYCSDPTPYCCGTGPGNYYCAKNVNGCTR